MSPPTKLLAYEPSNILSLCSAKTFPQQMANILQRLRILKPRPCVMRKQVNIKRNGGLWTQSYGILDLKKKKMLPSLHSSMLHGYRGFELTCRAENIHALLHHCKAKWAFFNSFVGVAELLLTVLVITFNLRARTQNYRFAWLRRFYETVATPLHLVITTAIVSVCQSLAWEVGDHVEACEENVI